MADQREVLHEVVLYARSGELIQSAIGSILPTVEACTRIVKIQPAAAPEVNAAVAHLHEAAEALQRAFTFTDARMGVLLGEEP